MSRYRNIPSHLLSHDNKRKLSLLYGLRTPGSSGEVSRLVARQGGLIKSAVLLHFGCGRWFISETDGRAYQSDWLAVSDTTINTKAVTLLDKISELSLQQAINQYQRHS